VSETEPPSAFWNRRYQQVDRLWSTTPNAVLAALTPDLSPGRALDLGAGEGRNAIWLARHGWRVTALDVSGVALARAAQRAADEGVPLECVEGDWREYRPGASTFDLAVLAYMHPDVDDRAYLFGWVAEALAPGGHLFVIGVHAVDQGFRGPPDPERLYTPERMGDALRGFDLLRCESIVYEAEHSEGRRQVTDVMGLARRAGFAPRAPLTSPA